MNQALLKKYGITRNCKSGETICREGEKGNTAFLLMQGSVSVKISSSKDAPVTVTNLQSGAFFGEMSLLEDRRRSATVTANRDGTVVLEIEKKDFLNVLRADSDNAYELMSMLLTRTNRTLEQLEQGRYRISFVAEVKRNKYYQLLQRMSREQFMEIVEKDSEYALTLLKFLSHTLAEIDQNI